MKTLIAICFIVVGFAVSANAEEVSRTTTTTTTSGHHHHHRHHHYHHHHD